MLDLISIGNISADLYFRADELTMDGNRFSLALGGKYPVTGFEMHVGGGGVNVAIAARRHGFGRVAVVGMIGKSVFRKSIIDRIEEAGVTTRYTMLNRHDMSLSMILLMQNGERTIISYEAPHEHVDEERQFLKKLPASKAVYFGNLPDVSMQDRRALMKHLKSKKVFITTNVGKLECCKPRSYINELLEYSDLLIVNTYEFSDLVKRPYDTIDFRASVLHYLPVMKDKLVIVTDGAQGSYAYQADNVYYQRAIKPRKIVDTTGAGDSYTGAFISTYLKHRDIQFSMERAAQNSARNLERIGAN